MTYELTMRYVYTVIQITKLIFLQQLKTTYTQCLISHIDRVDEVMLNDGARNFFIATEADSCK